VGNLDPEAGYDTTGEIYFKKLHFFGILCSLELTGRQSKISKERSGASK
jgi:hypothetical protein